MEALMPLLMVMVIKASKTMIQGYIFFIACI
jgi:hypothetical protein